MAQFTLQILVVLFLTCVVLSQNTTGGCSFTDAIPDQVYIALTNRVKAAPFSGDKLKVVSDFLSNLTLGFNSTQAAGLISLFSFSGDKMTVINSLGRNILTLDVNGVVAVINSVTFSPDKIDTLAVLVNLTSQADLKINQQKIIDLYTFGSDKDKARQLIAGAAPRSCLFGNANLTRFAFVIDVSGSMNLQFKDVDGSVYTRLQYVQKDLVNVMENALTAAQQFNVVSFSDSANAWRPGVVQVNRTNILSAESFVKALRPGGGTYMLNALKVAFADPNVVGIFFLSDGDPSDSSAAILAFATSVKKPVNTIAFKAEKSAQQFMYQLAVSSKGTFRAIV